MTRERRWTLLPRLLKNRPVVADRPPSYHREDLKQPEQVCLLAMTSL
jgi:hypothetical protein